MTPLWAYTALQKTSCLVADNYDRLVHSYRYHVRAAGNLFDARRSYSVNVQFFAHIPRIEMVRHVPA